MKFRITSAAMGVLLALGCATAFADSAGAAFPGNEAVRIVNGKRVVEAPPLTAATQRYIKGGGKLPPPSAGGEVFMIEGPAGLMECRSVYLSDTGCVPSTLGKTKRSRFWTVKVKGVWSHCESRAPSPKCEPASVGVPGGMGTVE
jgi:hypothetical protein